MAIKAIYIYAPTTVTASDQLVSITGASIDVSTPTAVDPGVYRAPGSAALSAQGDYDIVSLSDDKSSWPDPADR
jgi:hypothetical protein